MYLYAWNYVLNILLKLYIFYNHYKRSNRKVVNKICRKNVLVIFYFLECEHDMFHELKKSTL